MCTQIISFTQKLMNILTIKYLLLMPHWIIAARLLIFLLCELSIAIHGHRRVAYTACDCLSSHVCRFHMNNAYLKIFITNRCVCVCVSENNTHEFWSDPLKISDNITLPHRTQNWFAIWRLLCKPMRNRVDLLLKSLFANFSSAFRLIRSI